MKLLDLINILLNFYAEKGNVPIFYEGSTAGGKATPWEVKGVEIQDFDDTENDEKVVIY